MTDSSSQQSEQEVKQQAAPTPHQSVAGSGNTSSKSEGAKSEGLTFWQTVQGVMSAMLGVQSKKNAGRDFSKGKFSHFVVIGIVFTVLFVVTLITIIQAVVPDTP